MSPVALVTGASRGIGAACAWALADGGHDVGITYARDAQGAADTAAGVRGFGRRAHAAPAEARDSDAIGAAVAAVEAELGPLDALVLNAGATRDSLAVRTSGADWCETLEINLTGAFRAAQAGAAGMAARGRGAIVVMSSVVGRQGNPGQVGYAAAKAGLIGLTRALARELGPAGVRVNALAPGYIATRLTDALPEAGRARLLAATPLGRLGTPEDVAGPVAWLCSPAAAFVTGAVLDVDGGLRIP